MAQLSPRLFNPCSLDENEQIPAKIWELLRRNRDFRDAAERLTKLDAKERNDCEEIGKYHGEAWQKSWRLVKRAAAHHPFAGVALQWLVPEPLFRCHVATWPRGKKWKQSGFFIILRHDQRISDPRRRKRAQHRRKVAFGLACPSVCRRL